MTRRAPQRGATVCDQLCRLIRERLARKPGGHLVEAQLDAVELRLTVALRGPAAEPERFDQRLREQIDLVLDDAVQQAAAFRPGHAYCHRCESVDCAHSWPPSCRHVFVGFAPTGTPRWVDFAQHCLEQKHPRVDQLYDVPPALLALVQRQDALHGGMLAVFRNPSYQLLGQVVCGFFPVRARAEEGRGVLALTVQVAAWHSASGAPRLGLNLLGRAPSGESLDRLWDRLGELPWRRPVRWAQAALQSRGVEHRIDGILSGLARRLESDQRSRARRTQHAEHRHVSGERPTRKALDDARAVDAGTLLLDERTGTLVVLGDRGRTHFFTVEGQLVSSVRYSRDAIARKIEAELWLRVPADVREAFREKLAD